MLSSREIMQLENQRFYMSNTVPVSRQLNNKQQGSDLVINGVQQSSNLIQGLGTHMSVSNAPTVQSSSQNSTSSVYNGFYSSSTFNSINNFEASLQWLTESRIPNNGLLSEKNLNCNSHSAPSHSCCVNRLGGVDNVGMCSPLSGDSYRSSRESINYQTKPPALSVNVIDSVQNWFNLPPLPNQQYGSKFNDQNVNCSQMNLPMIEQTDLKQNDMCLQISDSYFEQTLNNNSSGNNNSNSRQINGIGDLNSSKITDTNEMTVTKSYNNSYQTNILSRDTWKQPLQTAASYISSPTLFNSLNESPEHYLYSLPPPTTSASSYCMVSDNISNIGNKLPQNNCLQQNLDKQPTLLNSKLVSCNDQLINNQVKIPDQSQLHHINHNLVNNNNRSNSDIKLSDMNGSRTSQNCNISNSNVKHSTGNSKYDENTASYAAVFMTENANDIEKNKNRLGDKKLTDVSKENTNIIEITDETTSGSEESNIIVEESDDMEEVDSVISINEMKKSYVSEEPVELRCLVCNIKSSAQTPATQFIHMNDSFPLTTASKTPVASKLIQILPADLQHFLKLHNSFMCRRCLNLIETVEVLEVKLTSVKQTLSENFSKTVQFFLPATPIVEIENGTAKIINKEIISCIEKSSGSDSTFSESSEMMRNSQKELTEMNESEESENEVYEKTDCDYDEDEQEENDKEDNCSEGGNYADDSESIDKQNEVNSKGGIQCRICTKILSSIKVYKKHMQLHTKCFSFYCEYCGKGFNIRDSLEKHLKLHNEDSKYQCEKCGKTFSQKHRLDNHLKWHLGEFNMYCMECGKGFMEKQNLDEHTRSHTKERPFICEICGSKFSKQSNLKAHLKICKKEEIKCRVCAEVFYSETHLKKHEVISHDAKPSAECNVCGKVFVNIKDLKPHMRSHSKEKQFECKLCGKRYKSISNLNHHAKIHDANKILKCTVCGEGFYRKKLLEDHMNRHSGERVYKCSQCDKEFFQHMNLLNHMRTHSDKVRLKPCQICGKKFRLGLKVHMRTHTGVKPYVCTHCGQAFSVSSTLSRHIQSKHQNLFES